MTIVSKIRELAVKLVVVVGEDSLSVEAQRNATILFMSLLRSTLNSKRALAEFKLNAEAFDWLVGEIETRFNAVSPFRTSPALLALRAALFTKNGVGCCHSKMGLMMQCKLGFDAATRVHTSVQMHVFLTGWCGNKPPSLRYACGAPDTDDRVHVLSSSGAPDTDDRVHVLSSRERGHRKDASLDERGGETLWKGHVPSPVPVPDAKVVESISRRPSSESYSIPLPLCRPWRCPAR